jgi:Sap, sulfolipid-1-addressing protein
MVVLLGQIIPIGLILALGPTRIMSTILLLTSAHPLRNALAFLGGVASVYLFVGGVTLLFFGRTLSDLNSGTIIIDAILIIAGVFLLVLAARSFFIAPDPDAPPPGWMQRVTSLSAGHAFLFGVVLAFSIRYLLIFLSAVALIYDAGVSPIQGTIALLVLVTLTLLFQIILVALYAANAKRARVQLSALMDWLNQHNRVIMTALFLILGIIFLVKGLNGLTLAAG